MMCLIINTNINRKPALRDYYTYHYEQLLLGETNTVIMNKTSCFIHLVD